MLRKYRILKVLHFDRHHRLIKVAEGREAVEYLKRTIEYDDFIRDVREKHRYDPPGPFDEVLLIYPGSEFMIVKFEKVRL